MSDKFWEDAHAETFRLEAIELIDDVLHSPAAAWAGIDLDDPRVRDAADAAARLIAIAMAEGYRRGLRTR